MSEVRSYSEAREPSATDTLMEAFRADPIFRGMMVDDAVRGGGIVMEGVVGILSDQKLPPGLQ